MSGKALEIVTFQATQPGATFTALTALTGDSGVIRNTRKPVRLLAAWSQRQVGGTVRILSPLLHDNVRGIQFNSSTGVQLPIRGEFSQVLEAQDTLALSMTGSTVVGDIEQVALLLQYDELPGIDGNFITAEQLVRRGRNRLGVRIILPQTVVTGQYDGASVITLTEDALKVNTEYAIIGVTMQVRVTSIGIRSPDWGNLRVGIPGGQLQDWDVAAFFFNLSKVSGLATIPVFNSANKGTTLVDYSDDENSAGTTVVLQLVELS